METIKEETTPTIPTPIPVKDEVPLATSPLPKTGTTWYTPTVRNLLIVAGIMVFILIVALIFVFRQNNTSNTGGIVPTSLPVPSVLASPQGVSEFSKTESFGVFSKSVGEFRDEIEKTDLSEPHLTYPLLDMNVNFEKN